jgi:hypothetical protein
MKFTFIMLLSAFIINIDLSCPNEVYIYLEYSYGLRTVQSLLMDQKFLNNNCS